MTYHFQCQCGSLRGLLSQPQRAFHGICYCKDCRAYSKHLGMASKTHDASGGAEFVATQARHVSFSEGMQHLACLSLSEKGLLRWYAKCCATPIGGTPRNWKIPYVGLVHTCLKADPAAFERAFPRLQMRVNTGSAIQTPPGLALRTLVSLASLMPRIVADAVTGAYKETPFFHSPAGEPVAAVTMLSQAERVHAYSHA
jgi:hypothetical protein